MEKMESDGNDVSEPDPVTPHLWPLGLSTRSLLSLWILIVTAGVLGLLVGFGLSAVFELGWLGTTIVVILTADLAALGVGLIVKFAAQTRVKGN